MFWQHYKSVMKLNNTCKLAFILYNLFMDRAMMRDIKEGYTMEYQTKILSKPTVQAMIKGLRSSGLKVKKIEGGYICKAVSPDQKEPITVFKAMNGNNNYLVRMIGNLFD